MSLHPSPFLHRIPADILYHVVGQADVLSELTRWCLVGPSFLEVAAPLLYDKVDLRRSKHVIPVLERYRLARSTTFDPDAPESLLLRYLRRTTALNLWALPPAKELVALSLAPRPAQVSNETAVQVNWSGYQPNSIRLFWLPRLLAEVRPLTLRERGRPSHWGEPSLNWSSAVVQVYLAEIDSLPIDSLPIDSLPTSPTDFHNDLYDSYEITASAATSGQRWNNQWRPMGERIGPWVDRRRQADSWPSQLRDVWDEVSEYIPVFSVSGGRSSKFWDSVEELDEWVVGIQAKLDRLWRWVPEYEREIRAYWPAPEVFAADPGTIHPIVLAIIRQTNRPSTLAAWCRVSRAVLPIAASRLYRTVKLKRAEDVIPHLELRRLALADPPTSPSFILPFMKETRVLNMIALPPADLLVALAHTPRSTQSKSDVELILRWNTLDEALANFWLPRLMAELRPAAFHEFNERGQSVSTRFASNEVDVYLAALSDLDPDEQPTDSPNTRPVNPRRLNQAYLDIACVSASRREAWLRSKRQNLLNNAECSVAKDPADPWARDARAFVIAADEFFPVKGHRSARGWANQLELDAWIRDFDARLRILMNMPAKAEEIQHYTAPTSKTLASLGLHLRPLDTTDMDIYDDSDDEGDSSDDDA